MDFFLQNETWEEYEQLLAGLREYYMPVGTAEELEVQCIAQCWWRLKRADRYENATMRVAVARKELADQFKYCDERDAEERDFILRLEKLSDEIEATEQVPTDLREKLVAMKPTFRPMWPLVENAARELLSNNSCFARLSEEASPEDHPRMFAVLMIETARAFVGHLSDMRRRNVTEFAYDRHAIPTTAEQDRILRYQVAFERQLTRAQYRLERLQRARKAEAVLPSVTVR
jgi:hypothetical protein